MITGMHTCGMMKLVLEILSVINIDPKVFVSNQHQLFKGTLHSGRTSAPGWGLCVCPAGGVGPSGSASHLLLYSEQLEARRHLTPVDDPP